MGIFPVYHTRCYERKPEGNGAQPLLHLASEIIASYPQGAFSRPEADRYVETTLLLLKAISRRYGRNIAKPMQLAFMANFNLWHKVAAKTHPAEKYVKAIFDSGQTLFDAICNSNFLISTLKENSPDDKGKLQHSINELSKLERKHIELTKIGTYVASGYEKRFLPRSDKRQLKGVKLDSVNEAIRQIMSSPPEDENAIVKAVFGKYRNIRGAYHAIDSFRRQVRRKIMSAKDIIR